MEPITKKDFDDALEKQAKAIEKTFQLIINPIKEDVEGNKKTLYGSNGTTGLVKAITVLQVLYGIFALGLGVIIQKLFL